MPKLRGIISTVSFLLLAVALVNCGGGGGGGGSASGVGSVAPGDSNPVYQVPAATKPAPVSKTVSVDVALPAGSSLNNETLTVSTFHGSSITAPKVGRYNKLQSSDISIGNIDKGQIVILGDSQNNPIFFAYLDNMSAANKATISTEAIAKAFLWMNPYVMVLPSSKKKEFMDKAITSTSFTQLKDTVDGLLVSDPKNLYNPDTHPEVIKIAFSIVKETFESLAIAQSISSKNFLKDIGSSDVPRIIDIAKQQISFENPKMVAYGLEAVDSSGKMDKMLDIVQGKGSILTFHWLPTRTEAKKSSPYVLPDGRYNVTFYKGFNTEINNWWLPYIPGSKLQFSDKATIVGTATWYNTFGAIDILIDALTGEDIASHIMNIISRIVKDADKVSGLYDLGKAINDGDPVETLDQATSFMLNNWGYITKAVWDSLGYSEDSPKQIKAIEFLSKSKALLKKIVIVIKAVDWVNEKIPFIWDLGFAPAKLTYCISESSGALAECSNTASSIPPTASLSCSPIYTYVGDTVTCDASASQSNKKDALMFRFDFDGDGNWDKDWSSSSNVTFSYPNKGPYNAKVEVKDSDRQTAKANVYITVNVKNKGLSTAVVIDKSGSMNGTPLTDAKNAVKTYLKYFGSADRAMVISFDENITVEQAFTSDISLIRNAIDNISSGNATAFYDAVYRAITETSKEDSKRRRAVIVLTDGASNRGFYKINDEISLAKYADVVDYAVQAGIPVYTIALNGAGITDDTKKMLYNLSGATKGRYYLAPDSAKLKAIYDDIKNMQ